jgi:hypothetical protein
MLLRCSSISCHVVLTLFPAPQTIKIEHFVGLIFDLSDKGAFFPFFDMCHWGKQLTGLMQV